MTTPAPTAQPPNSTPAKKMGHFDTWFMWFMSVGLCMLAGLTLAASAVRTPHASVAVGVVFALFGLGMRWIVQDEGRVAWMLRGRVRDMAWGCVCWMVAAAAPVLIFEEWAVYPLHYTAEQAVQVLATSVSVFGATHAFGWVVRHLPPWVFTALKGLLRFTLWAGVIGLAGWGLWTLFAALSVRLNRDYETGVCVSLALSGAWHVYGLYQRASVFHANLAKIGVRRSYITGQSVRGGSLLWEVPVALVLSGLLGLLSWLAVAAHVLLWGYEVWVRRRMPPRIAEAARRLREGPLTEREAAERFVAFAEALLGGTATPGEREKAILWVLSHVRFTGKDDFALDLFDRTPDGKLLAVGRDTIEKEVHARRQVIVNVNNDERLAEKWVFDVAEMRALHRQYTVRWDERPPPRLYDLRRSDAEHWEVREHRTREWASVPAQHASGLEALFQRLLAAGVPDIGIPTLTTYYAEELHEAAHGEVAEEEPLSPPTGSGV